MEEKAEEGTAEKAPVEEEKEIEEIEEQSGLCCGCFG